MTAVEVALFGGPMDGAHMSVQEDQRIVMAEQPMLTAREAAALEIPMDATMPRMQYAYARDEENPTRFDYIGERAVS